MDKTYCGVCDKTLDLDDMTEVDIVWIDGLGHICLDCDCNLEEAV
jgi:hypothetical protein